MGRPPEIDELHGDEPGPVLARARAVLELLVRDAAPVPQPVEELSLPLLVGPRADLARRPSDHLPAVSGVAQEGLVDVDEPSLGEGGEGLGDGARAEGLDELLLGSAERPLRALALVVEPRVRDRHRRGTGEGLGEPYVLRREKAGLGLVQGEEADDRSPGAQGDREPALDVLAAGQVEPARLAPGVGDDDACLLQAFPPEGLRHRERAEVGPAAPLLVPSLRALHQAVAFEQHHVGAVVGDEPPHRVEERRENPLQVEGAGEGEVGLVQDLQLLRPARDARLERPVPEEDAGEGEGGGPEGEDRRDREATAQPRPRCDLHPAVVDLFPLRGGHEGEALLEDAVELGPVAARGHPHPVHVAALPPHLEVRDPLLLRPGCRDRQVRHEGVHEA